MNIGKYKKSLDVVGILWSSSKDISKEIMIKIAKEYKLEQITIYDLSDVYRNFIYDCYQHDEDVMSDGYIDEKIARLISDSSHQIVAFTMEIENPTYQYNLKKNKQCIQARRLKEKIRNEFSSKINDYFLDNIIHLADNELETDLLVEVLNKYSRYCKKGYLRRGCEAKYTSYLFEIDNNTYINIVDTLNRKDFSTYSKKTEFYDTPREDDGER